MTFYVPYNKKSLWIRHPGRKSDHISGENENLHDKFTYRQRWFSNLSFAIIGLNAVNEQLIIGGSK